MRALIFVILTGCWDMPAVHLRPPERYSCSVSGMCDGVPTGGVYGVCAEDLDDAKGYVQEDFDKRLDGNCVEWSYNVTCERDAEMDEKCR